MDPQTLTVRTALDPGDLATTSSLAQLVALDDQPVALVRFHTDLLLGEKNPRNTPKDTTGGEDENRAHAEPEASDPGLHSNQETYEFDGWLEAQASQ
jgi:hypothetical protein